jgi:hypothetical protein
MNLQRTDVGFALCFLLFLCIALTGLTGYLQVKLDLHRFVFHKYLAYSTLFLTALHIIIHWKKVKGYVKRLLRL